VGHIRRPQIFYRPFANAVLGKGFQAINSVDCSDLRRCPSTQAGKKLMSKVGGNRKKTGDRKKATPNKPTALLKEAIIGS
jgi:hypothetical protein